MRLIIVCSYVRGYAKACPCYIQIFFSAVKIERKKNDIFFIYLSIYLFIYFFLFFFFLLKTFIVGLARKVVITSNENLCFAS